MRGTSTAIARPKPAVRRKRKKNNTAPGVMAERGGTPLKRGAAVQVMTYPRPKTKNVLVDASRRAGVSLSTFMIKSSLEKAEQVLNRQITDLIPESELRQYV